MPARLTAVRPGPATSTVALWTWISRARTCASPGSTRTDGAAVQRSAAERAGDDDAATLDREDPVDRERRRPRGRDGDAGRHRVADPPQGEPDVLDPGPVGRGNGQHRDAGERRARPGAAAPRRPPRRARASSTASIFVTTASPSRISSASSSARCSSVCALGPSSAATTSIAASISPAPTSMLPTSRSWPGTSTKSSSTPSSKARCAYPTSMVIPRRRSSGSRSASMPVSARSSVVLPWSMCPAVPMTTVMPVRRGPWRWRRPASGRRRARRCAGRAAPGRPRCAR